MCGTGKGARANWDVFFFCSFPSGAFFLFSRWPGKEMTATQAIDFPVVLSVSGSGSDSIYKKASLRFNNPRYWSIPSPN